MSDDITLAALFAEFPDETLANFTSGHYLFGERRPMTPAEIIAEYPVGDMLHASMTLSLEIRLDEELSLSIGQMDTRKGRGVELVDRYAEYHALPGIRTMSQLRAFVAALRAARQESP